MQKDLQQLIHYQLTNTMQGIKYYTGVLYGFLAGNFPKTFNIETGKDKLEAAFGVFQEAQTKANEAILVLIKESDKVETEIEVLTKEYHSKMTAHETSLSNIKEQKDRGYKFIDKLNDILK